MSVNIMKIVHVVPFYYPVIGGVENVAQTIAEYMASKGNDVYVLTYNRLRDGSENSLSYEETINNVHVIRVKPTFSWSHGTYSSELPGALRKLNPDLVHVHAWRHPHVFQVAKLKDELCFKAVLHGHAPFHKLSQIGVLTWSYHKVIDTVRKSCLKKYDWLIALTPHEKNILIKKFGIQEKKIVIIPNGIEKVDNRSEGSAPNSPVVLYLGRISRSKNVQLLVDAMKYASEERADMKLLLAGPDEGLIVKLKNRACTHHINIDYLSTVTEERKVELFKQCTIFAHPALYEPFGITLLEAQAFGKPCVITGDGGQIYVAPSGKTSMYALPNPKAFGAAISSMVTNVDLYKTLSANAKSWALSYLWSKILPEYDLLYDEMVKQSIREAQEVQ